MARVSQRCGGAVGSYRVKEIEQIRKTLKIILLRYGSASIYLKLREKEEKATALLLYLSFFFSGLLLTDISTFSSARSTPLPRGSHSDIKILVLWAAWVLVSTVYLCIPAYGPQANPHRSWRLHMGSLPYFARFLEIRPGWIPSIIIPFDPYFLPVLLLTGGCATSMQRDYGRVIYSTSNEDRVLRPFRYAGLSLRG